MSLRTVVPQTLERQLYQVITDIVRQAVDGSNNPIQITVGINIVGNDLTIATIGKGIVLPDSGGTTHTVRLEALYDSVSDNWVPVLTNLT